MSLYSVHTSNSQLVQRRRGAPPPRLRVIQLTARDCFTQWVHMSRYLLGIVGEGDLVGAADVVILVVQRVQRRLEGHQVAVAQVVGVRQAPLPPAVRVAPAVALPASRQHGAVSNFAHVALIKRLIFEPC